ncbi:P-loop NTPase family protein [Acidithiobacillus caldus]|uniref:hypothetical protein n=1 Tax=Acidithiobacillus caldus TaxID=33059 RepID=UPI001C070FDE|nr:hypothetical protein [Acidithiobacillus caldus]MBU2770095.1 ATP-binding protein [Acidithiobacillus caldus]
MKQRIIFSHGDKGGVGKSAVAALLMDLSLRRYGKAGLVEGDTTTPDVWNRYRSCTDVIAKKIPLNLAGDASTAIGQLSVWLQELGEKAVDVPTVIVNLPANASETLDQHAAMLVRVCKKLGYDVSACYSIGAGNDAADALGHSLDTGFLSMLDPDKRAVIYPAMFGPKSAFVWHVRQKDTDTHDYRHCVLPKLEPAFVASMVFTTEGPFSQMRAGLVDGFGPYQEVVLEDWLEQCDAALWNLLPENEDRDDGQP